MKICDFIGSRRIGPPPDWDDTLDGPCGSIYVIDSIDTLTGLSTMYSFYKPTDEDIEALRDGGLIRLGITGMRQHPIFQLGVLSQKIAAQIAPVERGDLGSVITGDTQ